MVAACQTVPNQTNIPKVNNKANVKLNEPFMARLTYYTRHEDKWGNRVAMPVKGKRAKQGVTLAAHSDFPFQSLIDIPVLRKVVGGTGPFVVEDRGRDVERKKASRRNSYVFDAYMNMSNRQMKRFAGRMPAYVPVTFKGVAYNPFIHGSNRLVKK
jgi:hypothetical protein